MQHLIQRIKYNYSAISMGKGGEEVFHSRSQQSAKKQSDGVAFRPFSCGARTKLAHCCEKRED